MFGHSQTMLAALAILASVMLCVVSSERPGANLRSCLAPHPSGIFRDRETFGAVSETTGVVGWMIFCENGEP